MGRKEHLRDPYNIAASPSDSIVNLHRDDDNDSILLTFMHIQSNTSFNIVLILTEVSD